MADVFNHNIIVTIIIAFSAYLIIKGIVIFIGKAGKVYLENSNSDTGNLYLQLIGGFYILSGLLGLFLPGLEWETEDIYFSIGIYAMVSCIYWIGLDVFMRKKKKFQQN